MTDINVDIDPKLLQWFNSLQASMIDKQIGFLPETQTFIISTKLEGKVGDLLTSITVRGNTPQAAIEALKTALTETYRVFYGGGAYWIFVYDEFINVPPNTANRLAKSEKLKART